VGKPLAEIMFMVAITLGTIETNVFLFVLRENGKPIETNLVSKGVNLVKGLKVHRSIIEHNYYFVK
jgi:hypothetical protein